MTLNRESYLAAVLQEHQTRQNKGRWLKELCFDKQLEFITDTHRWKTACCGGRAGKTVADAAYLINAANSKPRSVALYLTLSRNNAKKLVWPELLNINSTYKLGGIPNESDLSLKMQNGSFIYASGASHAKEIEKFRGLPLVLCIIDEIQSFPSYVQRLIDDVVSKRLFDFNGTLALTGTPGPTPAGYFYDTCQNIQYKHFHWTMFDNPWIQIKSGKTPQLLLDEEMQRKGVTLDDPSIQREVFGKWTLDTNALVFRYDLNKNHYEELPQFPKPWSHIIGVDLGYDDADAIAVIGWNEASPATYLVAEEIQQKQGITELALKIESLIARYNPIRIVMDTGGLGKKIAEEIRTRYAIPIMAAEKVRKFEFIELLNDAMRTSRFYANRKSRFAHDSQLIEWDRDPERVSETPKIRDSYHSDICDAVLYAFRECLHWLHEPEPARIEPATPEWYAREVQRMEDTALEMLRNSKQESEPDWGWG